MILSSMNAFFYKVVGVIGNPGVPTGYIQPSDGAARIAGLLNLMIAIAAIFATFYIIYGGYEFISSNGDAGKVKTATAVIQWAVTGLVITLAAYLIVGIVFSVLGVQKSMLQLPF